MLQSSEEKQTNKGLSRLKRDILKQGKKLKGSDVYINEHLTKKNADIARVATNEDSINMDKKWEGDNQTKRNA